MKLLKTSGCLFPDAGGNVKEQTMIVEEQGELVLVSTGAMKLVKLSACDALNGKPKYKR